MTLARRIRRIAVRGGNVCGVGIWLLLALPPVWAQQPTGASLILGTVAGDPGTTATIPLYYQRAPGLLLRSARLEIEFVSNSVKFSRAQKGPASEVQDFQFAVQVKELPADDKNVRRARLTVDASVEGSATEALPEGLWGFLDFAVPPDAKPFSISLNPVSVSAQDTRGNDVVLATEAGKIIVVVPDAPMATCFFFTH